jgi:acetyl-CoA synthetase
MLQEKGIKKGDVVGIYLPLIPEALVFMLACARIGAIHSVVFSAFSADALKTRLRDGRAKLLISCDYYYRKGKKEDLTKKVKEATKGMKIKKITIKRNEVGRFLKKSGEVDPIEMESNDILLILYTSGTTGKPKGVIHDTGGYAVQALWTTRLDFNLRKGDIMWCTADIGWITGHTYACYGPLLNGSTTLIYEGATNYPTSSRLFEIIEDNKINVFYTAPTAIRIFAVDGDKYAKKFKLNSLRVLGTVGEPIDEEAWFWYFNNIGKGRCPIIDTWWQTETGGTLINSLPGIGPIIPTFAGKSFPGTRHDVVDEKGRSAREGKQGLLVQLPPYAPGMLRGIWRNKKRYKKYFKYNMYFTGDNAFKKGEEFRILGRADDIIKVAGHRLSTAEIENVIDSHPSVSESAVVSKPEKIKGEAIVVFIKLKRDKEVKEEEIAKRVREKISPIATPSEIYFVHDLPKTRSGKIMRRVLKALLRKEELKALTTLVNPECVEDIKEMLR